MKKFIAFIVLVAIVTGSYMYRNDIKTYIKDLKNDTTNEKLLREKPLLLREYPPKEVEIFELGKDIANLNFFKTGTANAQTTVYVSPQTTGKITDISVKVGDAVKEGETLITLGDSLSTDIANLQYLAAKEGLEIANSTLYLTKQTNLETLKSARSGITSAKESYENSINTKENTYDISDLQVESAQLALEIAKDAYDDLKDDYNDAKDALEDLEDQYDELKSEQPDATDALEKLQNAIALAETGLKSLKSAKENSKNGIEQTEIGLEQLEESIVLQMDQLDYAINMASLQYGSTIDQLEALQLSTQLQKLGIEGQIAQAQSSYDIAKLNREYQNITSPIAGIVTAVNAEKGNLAAPGQTLVQIENLDKISIKTSVNEQEAKLLKIGDKVKIDGETGKIISINPTLNQTTKKIDVEIETDSPITPGSFVKVVFVPSAKKSIFVPLNSISIIDGEKIVKTINEDLIVKCITVETGQIIDNYIEITNGLKGNETIITSIITLKEGEKIALLN
jgi:RND family efflux transporter MFP subunit